MRIDHHRAGAVRHHRAHKFRQRDHRAFDVKMPVDQTRGEIRAVEIDHLFRFVIAESDDAAVIHRDVRFVNLAAQDVDELGVLEEQLGRFFAARDAELVLQFSH